MKCKTYRINKKIEDLDAKRKKYGDKYLYYKK
jgi:hypothetical protein